VKSFEDLEALSRANRHQETIALAQDLLRTNPGHGPTHRIFGQSLSSLGKPDLAITCFENALRIDPSDRIALNALGLTLISQRRAREALAPLERARALDGTDATTNLYLGLALLNLRDYPGAVVPLSAAVEKEPGSSKAWGNLGSAYLNLHRYKEAAICQQNALRLAPNREDFASKLLQALNLVDINQLDTELLLSAFKLRHEDFFSRHPHLHPVIADVVNFNAWRKNHAVHTIEIDAARPVTLAYREPPIEDHYVADASWVAELRYADIIAGWDHVIAPGGAVLDGSGYLGAYSSFAWIPHAYSRPANRMIHLWSDSYTQIDEPSFFLSNPQEFQVGHWIVDFLPRIRGWTVAKTASPLKLAIPKSLPKRHREFLSLLGVQDSDLLELEVGNRYRFSSLWVMGQGHRNDPHPNKIEFLHKALTTQLEDVVTPALARVYLDRGQSPRGRNIVNLAEFDATLREFEFTFIQLANHPAAQQVEILGKAAIAIGSLGTDLASIFHMRSGTDLIMLVQPDMHTSNVENDARAFERYAAILGMRSHRLTCTPQRDEKAERAFWKRALYYRDVVVDCAALRKLLREVLKPRV